jgi:hypothetical protein
MDDGGKEFEFQICGTLVKGAFKAKAGYFRTLGIGSSISLCNLVIEHEEPP